MADEAVQLKKTLTIYAFTLAGVTTASIGILLIIQEKHLSISDILAAIGLNLIASVVFATIFALISTRIQARLQDAAIAVHDAQMLGRIDLLVSGLKSEIVSSINLSIPAYMPLDTFPPSNTYDQRLNQALSRSLSQSGVYYFRGASGRYVSARIKQANHRILESVKVAMIDPASETALSFHADDRRRQQSDVSQSDAELVEMVREEALMSIVALFDCRHICAIDIGFIASNGITRIELFDDSVFISHFSNTVGPDSKFPMTVKFKSGSFPYDFNRLEIQRLIEVADRRITLNNRYTEVRLLADLSDLLGRPVTVVDIDRWRRAHAAYMATFVHMLADA